MERTLFFVKPYCIDPYIDRFTPLDIIDFLEKRLRQDGKGRFRRVAGVRAGPMPKEFWLKFYTHVEGGYPHIYWPMCNEFAGGDLAIFVYEGPNMAERIKKITGPTLYINNIGKGTIREIWGNKDMGYRTIVHSSDPDSVEREIRLFKKYGYLRRLRKLK